MFAYFSQQSAVAAAVSTPLTLTHATYLETAQHVSNIRVFMNQTVMLYSLVLVSLCDQFVKRFCF